MKHFIKQVFSLQFLVSKPLIVLLITAGCGLWTEINAQYRQDRSIIRGNVTSITIKYPGDITTDSLFLQVRTTSSFTSTIHIAKENTVAGGSDAEILATYSYPYTTVKIFFSSANTSGLAIANYYYDLRKSVSPDSAVLIYGTFKIQSYAGEVVNGLAGGGSNESIIKSWIGDSADVIRMELADYVLENDLSDSLDNIRTLIGTGGVALPDSVLFSTDSTAQRTFSDLKYVDKASTQDILGQKNFLNNKTVFGTTTNDSVGVRGRLDVDGKLTVGNSLSYMKYEPFDNYSFKLRIYDNVGAMDWYGFTINYPGFTLAKLKIMIAPSPNPGILSMNGSSVNASDVNWVNGHPYSLYSVNGFRTDGDIIGGEYSKIFLTDTVFVKTVKINSAYSFPTADGTNGQVLKTNGSGILTWANDLSSTGVGSFNPDYAYLDTTITGEATLTDEVKDSIRQAMDLYRGVNSWFDYSASNVLRLGKSYNDKRFNNGAYSDVWNIDYVIPPYNLSADWLYSIEHRTDYFNDTLNTVAHSDIVNIDGTGTPIWKTNDVRIMGNEIAVNVGDLPDSVALNWSLAGLTGNKVILSEANKTAVESRFPMPVRGFEFKFGSVPNYIFPRVYSFFSDLTTNTPSLETAYHFYGQGNYPSYFGGNILTDGYIIGLTGKFSNLSNNTIPYNNTSTGLADSRISQDANTTYIRGGNTATSLGSELLTNGTFDTDLSGWTAGAGWGWDSRTAKHTTGNTATLEQSFSTSNNVMYQITVTITNRTAGSITLSFNNGQQNYAGITATGTYHILSTLTGSNKIIITPTTDFNGSMDEVSVKLLTASLPSFILKNTDNSNSGVQIRTGNSANNFYFGIDAGKNNTTGIYNSAIGYQALLSNTIGQLNLAIGYQALYSNTTGQSNSAIGYQALYSNTSGYYNSAIGRDALRSNTTGYYNSAIGRDALYSNTTGNYNSAIGYFALRSIVGQGNIGISYQAGRYNADNSEHTTGNYSNYFGYDTKASTNGVSNENVFGYQAVGMGSNTFVFGSNAITDTYLKGKVHINNDLDVAGYGYFADSIVVGNSTVKIYPDSITIGGIKVNPSGGSGIDTAKVNDLIKDYNDSTGVSIIGTQGTLDSLITDYWNDNLGGGGTPFDSTYAYQRITALEDSITAFRSILNSILAALDDKLDKSLLAGGTTDQVLAKIDGDDYNFTWATIEAGEPVFPPDETPPSPPTGLNATATDESSITLNWTDPADGDLDSIRIYEYKNATEDSTAMTWIASVGAGVETYNRTGLDAETTYWYRLKAMDDSGNVSYFSNVDSATTQASSGGIPVIESFTTDSVEASATITLTKPSGVQNGDLLLIVVASDDPTDNQQWNDTTNKPTGFTWLSTTIGGGVGTGQNDCQTHIAAFYRIADGSEGATVGVTSVGTGNDQVGYYLRLSGVYGTSPIDVWDSPLDSTLYQQTDTIQIHSQTTGYDNELALVVCANDGGNYGLTVSGTGWSAVSDNWVIDSEFGLHLIIGKKDMPSAGATGQAIITSSVTTPHGSKVGMILTVRSQQ